MKVLCCGLYLIFRLNVWKLYEADSYWDYFKLKTYLFVDFNIKTVVIERISVWSPLSTKITYTHQRGSPLSYLNNCIFSINLLPIVSLGVVVGGAPLFRCGSVRGVGGHKNPPQTSSFKTQKMTAWSSI